MKKAVCLMVFISLSLLYMGCSTAHKATKEAGKPVGGFTRAIEGVAEGAAEGYGKTGLPADKTGLPADKAGSSPQSNPYGRQM